MQSITETLSAASKAVFGEGTTQQPSTEEPPSGETGKGTPMDPYDAGNKPEQDELSSADKLPAQEESKKDESKTEETKAEEPKIEESKTEEPKTEETKTEEPTAEESTSVPTTEAKSSGSDEDKPAMARTPSFALKVAPVTNVTDNAGTVLTKEQAQAQKSHSDATSAPEQEKETPNGTTPAATTPEDLKKSSTSSPFESKNEILNGSAAAKRAAFSPERSVSPGTTADGRHAETGKQEKTKLSTKLKEKLHIGRH